MMTSLLPQGQVIPPAILNTLWTEHQHTPFVEPSLAYTLKVPKPWLTTKRSSRISSLGLEWLESFTDTAQATVHIQVTQLRREISAGDWLKYYALRLDKQILTVQPASAKQAEGLLRGEKSETILKERVRATLHGPWLMLISCLTSEKAYPHLAETFGLIVTSFRFLHPPSQITIEPCITYQLEHFQFECPSVWQPQSTHKETIELAQSSGSPGGLLKVTALNARGFNSPAQWLEKTLDGFPQISVQNLLHHAPLSSPNPQFSQGHLMIYQADHQGTPQELWLSRFGCRTHDLTITLLTPSREVFFYPWALNKRAYGILLESLREEV